MLFYKSMIFQKKVAEIKQKEQKKLENIKKRKNRFYEMTKKTQKGQPVLATRINKLLDKIKANKK